MALRIFPRGFCVIIVAMLQVTDVFFKAGRREILRGLSLSVRPGEFVVITGPNGGGKSTLAQIIMGTQKASSGKILFRGEDISGKSLTERARAGIAFAFQRPVHFKGLTVRDLLQIAATGQETFLDDGGLDYAEMLAAVGLGEDYLGREVNDSLSGGELKRIEIATAIARRAPLTIFDEPEAGIDIWSFSKLVKLFGKMRDDHRSLIVISHQKRLIEMADRIVLLRDGKVINAHAKMEDLAQ